MTTRIPMTKAAIQYHSGASRRKVNRWLDDLVAEGVVDLDSDDAGELEYTVPGARRAPRGPTTFAEAKKLASLGADVAARPPSDTRALTRSAGRDRALARLRGTVSGTGALTVASSARRELEGKREPSEKSVLLSGGLSFFLGPFGWLYAGAWREAVPASAAYLLVMALVPTFLLLPLLPFAMGLSGVAGLVYAMQHNRSGGRTPILGSGHDE